MFRYILNFYKQNKVGFIGIICTIIFGSIAIYYVFYTPQPEISYTILSDSNVVDLHKPLKDLKILFQDEDIQKNNMNLKIYSLKISNSGKKNILETNYPSDQNWGIKITDGRIIESRLVESNSDYLKNHLTTKIVDDNTINFKKVIFDKNDYFTLEVLVLHSKDSDINLIPFGKISGISKNQTFKKLDTTRRGIFQNIYMYWQYFVVIYFLLFLIIEIIRETKRKWLEKTMKDRLKSIETNLSSSKNRFNYFMDFFYDDKMQELLRNNPDFLKSFKDFIRKMDSSSHKS